MESEVEAARNLLTGIEESVEFLLRESELRLALSKQGADEVERIVSELSCERQLVKERLDRNTSLISKANFERETMAKTILSSATASGGVWAMELAVVERASSSLETHCSELEAKISLLEQQRGNQEEATKSIVKAAKDFQSKVQEAKTKHESQKASFLQTKAKAESSAMRYRYIQDLEASNDELADTVELMKAAIASKKAEQESQNGRREAEAGGTSPPSSSLELHIVAEELLARVELEQNHGSMLLGQVAQAMQLILNQNSPPAAITIDQTGEEADEESLGKSE